MVVTEDFCIHECNADKPAKWLKIVGRNLLNHLYLCNCSKDQHSTQYAM